MSYHHRLNITQGSEQDVCAGNNRKNLEDFGTEELEHMHQSDELEALA